VVVSTVLNSLRNYAIRGSFYGGKLHTLLKVCVSASLNVDGVVADVLDPEDCGLLRRLLGEI
jgi:hypothetical protein